MFELLPSLERIAFQTNSQLARKVITVCQKFQDWITETRKKRLVDGVLPPFTKGRMQEVMDYANKKFTPELIKILLDELNLKIRIICASDMELGGCVFNITRDLSAEELNHGLSLSTGMQSYNENIIDLTIFDDLEAKVNLEKSSLDKVPKSIMAVLIIFPVILLTEELNNKIEPFTAEEFAAIILHECGHAISDYEHYGDIYHRADIVGNSIRYLNEKADSKIINVVTDNLEKAPRKVLPKTAVDAFDAVMKEVDILKKEASGISPAVAVLAVPGTIVALATLWYLKDAFWAALDRISTSAKYGTINNRSNKTSDTVVTMSNSGYEERLADEFVSRHGLGAALISALKKMHDVEHININLSRALKNHQITASILCMIDIVGSVFGMLLYTNDNSYDPELLRYKSVLLNNMVVFKDDKLSPELRSFYIKETQQMLVTINKLTGSTRYKIAKIFMDTILRITSRGSIVDTFRTAGLSHSYDILQQLTCGLIKNKLYYHSARLQNLK